MPRKKRAATLETGPITIHSRIARAAHLFTQEILHILGSSTLDELTALSHDDQPAPRAQKSGPPVRRRSLEFLKDIGRIPVQCPVSGCNERGIRSKMNFCMGHSVSVSKTEQTRLREAQKAGTTAPAPPRRLPAKGGRGKRSAGAQPSA